MREGAGVIIHSATGCVEAAYDLTTNTMGYVAVSKALLAYKGLGRIEPLVIRTSSRIVVSQMLGVWKARHGAYSDMHAALVKLVAACPFDVRWEAAMAEENLAFFRTFDGPLQATSEIG